MLTSMSETCTNKFPIDIESIELLFFFGPFPYWLLQNRGIFSWKEAAAAAELRQQAQESEVGVVGKTDAESGGGLVGCFFFVNVWRGVHIIEVCQFTK